MRVSLMSLKERSAYLPEARPREWKPAICEGCHCLDDCVWIDGVGMLCIDCEGETDGARRDDERYPR